MNSCDEEYLSEFDNSRMVNTVRIIFSKTFTINEQIAQIKQNVPEDKQDAYMRYFAWEKLQGDKLK